MGQQPLLNGGSHPPQYQTANNVPPNSIEIHKTSDSTLNGDECDKNAPAQNEELKTESDHEHENEEEPNEWDTGTTTFTASSMQTFPFYNESESEDDVDHRSAWNIFSKLNILNFKRKKKKYKKIW